MRKSMRCENAVSPVIGTILLVAITVVLVAIIAAVVMGMSGNVSNTKNVGLTVTPTYMEGELIARVAQDGVTVSRPNGLFAYHKGVVVMIYGGEDVNQLVNLTVSFAGANSTKYVPLNTLDVVGTMLGKRNTPIERIGTPILFIPEPQSTDYTNARVVVMGNFTDGTSAVLYDSTLSLAPSPAGIDPHFSVGPSMFFNNFPLSPIFA